MLRGRPSRLRPQRSMARAWLTAAPRHASVRRAIAAPSSTPTSSTVTPPPACATAARTAPAQGVSTAIRAGTPHARKRRSQQRGADRAVGLGRRDVAARHEKAGDQADAAWRRPAIRAAAPRPPAVASIRCLGLASDIAADHGLDGGDPADDSLLLGDIHSRPIVRRIVDQAVDPHAHHVVVALPPADGLRGGLAAADQFSASTKPPIRYCARNAACCRTSS